MKWPLVWRSTHEAEVALLTAELELEQQRARRRVKRNGTGVREITIRNDARSVVGQPFVDVDADDQDTPDELPPVVLEAIEARAGSLSSRTASQMATVAMKQLAHGEPVERVVQYMYRGERDE